MRYKITQSQDQDQKTIFGAVILHGKSIIKIIPVTQEERQGAEKTAIEYINTATIKTNPRRKGSFWLIDRTGTYLIERP